MKNIFLFIGIGLLLSGCEATDPDIYKCLEKSHIEYDEDGKGRANDPGRYYFFIVLDKKQKTVIRLNQDGSPEPWVPEEVYYTEEDNLIYANEITEPNQFYENGMLHELRLDKISGTFSITRYDGISNDDPKMYRTTYRCERTEPVIR
tara:strand:+ start:430 stop:873 length:444 start_codon:yes stop_codon:yes gene_type:complete